MEKINSKMIVIVMLLAVFLNLANGQEINFDFDMKTKVEKSFFELKSDIKPVIPEVSSATVISSKRIKEVDNSILNSIRYCEKNDISPTITDGLKKLLVYGNNEEKLSFLNSKDKFVIPQRLSSFETPDIKNIFLSKEKGYQTQCYQYNCRMEKVCGIKKSCSRFCQLVGIACGVAGYGITQYYTGGTMPTTSTAVGLVAQTGCSWACEDWICEDIEDDCNYVQKCDTRCETVWVNDNADQVDPNSGQVTHM
jgi:hypothetical protein